MGGHALYALAWTSFGLGHSLLARPGPRAWLKARCGRAMRLAYNAIAVLHLALVLWVGHVFVAAEPFDFGIGWTVARGVLAVAGVLVLWVATRSYDMRMLAGLSQLGGPGEDDEPFRAEGALRYVRHPLYSGLILLLAAGIADGRSLATFVLATLYIVIGYRHEERGLLRRLGADYARYRAQVPALVPWRGRAWAA